MSKRYIGNVFDAEPDLPRDSPLAMGGTMFRALGYGLVDQVAEFLDTLPDRPVTRDAAPATVRRALHLTGPLPELGTAPGPLLEQTAQLLFEYSLLNGHPRCFGSITAPPAPIGILGDLLAAAVNADVAAWVLGPAATEIEAQTIRWIASLLGYPEDAGGLFVSGGNMANILCFLAARTTMATWDIGHDGIAGGPGPALRVYASAETHGWIQKAADITGLGTATIRWIATDVQSRMSLSALRRAIAADVAAGDVPCLVVGTAGSVNTGAIDPLPGIAALCKEYGVWFHVDGGYGGFAAAIPDAPADLRGIALADSVAVDPHRWLYAPLEAGCVLVRDREILRSALSWPSSDLPGGEPATDYIDGGPQSSRGFHALNVWLALKHAGAAGYRTMIAEDIRLSQAMAATIARYGELQLMTQALSITTFRYVPPDLVSNMTQNRVASYLDTLNRALLDRLQRGGEVFVSAAMVRGAYVLRACIVNFRTAQADIEALPAIVARLGRAVDAELRPAL
jgi:aromatic-L-amino-acid decarboxylase